MVKNSNIGICIWCIPKQGAQRVKIAADMGYKGVVLDLGKKENGHELQNTELQKEYVKAAKESGIKLTTLAANTFCDNTVCGENRDEKFIDEIDNILVETASAMGIKMLQIPSFVNSYINTVKEIETTATHLKSLCKLAAGSGITVCTENALNAHEALHLLNLVQEDNLKIIYDTANPYWLGGGKNGPEILKATLPHVCEVHLKDVAFNKEEGKQKFIELGKGEVEFMESVEILKKSNFSGWIHNENEYSVKELAQDFVNIQNMFN